MILTFFLLNYNIYIIYSYWLEFLDALKLSLLVHITAIPPVKIQVFLLLSSENHTLMTSQIVLDYGNNYGLGRILFI